jgi:hypothetical protein
VVNGKIVTTEEIPGYCAVALAGIGDLPDTILSRSVVIKMRRRAPDEKVEPFRRRVHAPLGEVLFWRLVDWAGSVAERATGAWPKMPDGVRDRDADVWEALLAVADLAGGNLAEARACCGCCACCGSEGEHAQPWHSVASGYSNGLRRK